MNLPQHARGFTLIELLVVIAIIGLLSSVILASLNSARQKSRNARRVADLAQIRNALELYYSSNGRYPAGDTIPIGWHSQCASWGSFAANNVIPGLVPNYMPSFPADPSMNTAASTCCYLYTSRNDVNGNYQDYKLLDHQCSDISYTSQPGLLDPARDGGPNGSILDGATYWSWAIWTPRYVAY